MARNKNMQNVKKEPKTKRRGRFWVGFLNTILILIVVVSMLLMIVSELVIDQQDRTIFGFQLQSAQTENGEREGDLILVKGEKRTALPYVAAAASFANSVTGYIVLIFPPCALLILVQVIAAGRENREEQLEAQTAAASFAPPAEPKAPVNAPLPKPAMENEPPQAPAKQQERPAAPSRPVLPPQPPVQAQTAAYRETPVTPHAEALRPQSAPQPEPAAPTPSFEETIVYHLPPQMRQQPQEPPMQQTRQPDRQELLEDIEQLKRALYESRMQNEEIRARAAQEIRRARAQAQPHGDGYPQMSYAPQDPAYQAPQYRRTYERAPYHAPYYGQPYAQQPPYAPYGYAQPQYRPYPPQNEYYDPYPNAPQAGEDARWYDPYAQRSGQDVPPVR